MRVDRWWFDDGAGVQMITTAPVQVGTPYRESDGAGSPPIHPRNDPREQWHMPPMPPPANDNAPRAIGLMGYGGSGKSEVARILANQGFTRTHIKNPMRAMAATLLEQAGYSPDEIESYLDGELKREPIPALRRSGTEIQQFLGTEFGRDFCYPALWLDLWRANAKAILGDGGKVVQESVRFPNEAEAIREMGGVIVRVERPGIGPLSGHISEKPPSEPDFTIYNRGTLIDLALQVASQLATAA